MIIHLIRHGETVSNRDGLGLGRADLPLTEVGERQAAAAGARLLSEPIARIYSSPLQRALTVARAIAGERDIPLDIRPELTELDVGETEGMTFAEMRERFPDFLKAWAGDACASVRMPGGECLDDVAARLRPLVAELRAEGDQTVAVVSHNFVMRVILCELLGIGVEQFRSFAIDLASLSTVVVRNGRVSVRALNDRCHLEPPQSAS